MITTYILDNFDPSDKTVKITFVNEDDLVYERVINIPHLGDGSVDEEYFQEIIQGQIRGVENKAKVGVIEFKEPVQNTGIGTT